MLGCKAANTPMESVIKSNFKEGPLVDKDSYQSLVGKLIYLTHTRPDIGFFVNMTSRYMTSPTEVHMKAVNRILQYLKGTPGKSLHFKKNSNRGIEVYTDSNWTGYTSDRNSTTGYCSFGTITIDHVPSCNQTAGVLTKALPINTYENIRSKLGMIDIYHPD